MSQIKHLASEYPDCFNMIRATPWAASYDFLPHLPTLEEVAEPTYQVFFHNEFHVKFAQAHCTWADIAQLKDQGFQPFLILPWQHQETCIIHKISACKQVRRKTFYHVHWLGSPQATWEPEENLGVFRFLIKPL